MTLVTDGKANFIQRYLDRCKDHCHGILQWGKEIGLNSKHEMGKWEFLVKERIWGSVEEKIIKRKNKSKEVLVKQTFQDSWWRQARVIRHHLGNGGGWGTWSDIWGDRLSSGGFWWNCLSMNLAKTEFLKKDTDES